MDTLMRNTAPGKIPVRARFGPLMGTTIAALLPYGMAEDSVRDRASVAPRTIAVSVQFVTEPGRGEGAGKLLSAPKVNTVSGQEAVIRMVAQRYLPKGVRQGETGTMESTFDDPTHTGSTLEVVPELADGRIRLRGHATTVDFLGYNGRTRWGETTVVSYSLRKTVTPFSVLVVPGGDFVSIPSADRGTQQGELRLKAEFVPDDGNKPHSVRLEFVPGADPQSSLESSDGAVWSPLRAGPDPQLGGLFLQAWAGIGHEFPVKEEGGPTLFEVAVVEGNDARLVVEVRSEAPATQTVELKRDQTVPVEVDGATYELLYPTCDVSSAQNRTTTNKAMLIVTTPRRRKAPADAKNDSAEAAQAAITEDEAVRLAKEHIADAGGAQTFTAFTVVRPGHEMVYAWIDRNGRKRTGSATDFYGELLTKHHIIECRSVPTSPSDGAIGRTVLVDRISGATCTHDPGKK